MSQIAQALRRRRARAEVKLRPMMKQAMAVYRANIEAQCVQIEAEQAKLMGVYERPAYH